VIDAVRLIRDDIINPDVYRAACLPPSPLWIGSTVLLRFAYQHPPWDDLD